MSFKVNAPEKKSIELKRVVVTGLGVITPIGKTVSAYWNSLLAGRSGADVIHQFDATHHPCQIACEVKDFKSDRYLDAKAVKRMDRFSQFAVAAAKQALSDANFEINELNETSVGTIVGCGIGGAHVWQQQQAVFTQKGPKRCSPFTIPMIIPNMAAGLVAIHTGAKGHTACTTTACAASAHAIGDACQWIRQGKAVAMLCGGTESAITPLMVASFASAKALSTRNDAPARASRPFDRDRDGFVMGEGAGILLIEELEHAIARKARIYSEIIGYGTTCDAYHITRPRPGGINAAIAMELALKDAGCSPSEVDYINAHGTSTVANDTNETAAIKKALGKQAVMIQGVC
ncbi:MAG: beta-ketoacyl-ACP synthase II [Phormidesmis sp.]